MNYKKKNNKKKNNKKRNNSINQAEVVQYWHV